MVSSFFSLFTFHQRLEIRKCDGLTHLLTYQLTWVGARDTCLSKKEYLTYQYTYLGSMLSQTRYGKHLLNM